MYVVKPINKNVINLKTGIDITVPNVVEIEAPLGGTSTEYEIVVVTNLPDFKSQIRKDDEVVQFSVQKAYKEIEIFHDKVDKKWKNTGCPSIPKGRDSLKHSSEEKRKWLDGFMSHVASDSEISHSTLFHQFIGISRLKKAKETATIKSPEAQDNSCTISDDSAPIVPDHQEISSLEDLACNENNAVPNKEGSDLFPKMKVRKSSQSDPLSDSTDATVSEVPPVNHDSTSDNDLDLFAEFSKQKVTQTEALPNKSKNISDALFCDTDDDLFRINSPTPPKSTKEATRKSSVEKVDVTPAPEPKELGLFEELNLSDEERNSQKLFWDDKTNDDSFQEKKFGNVPLFQEQDLQFGGFTKEEERLFYIPKEEIKKSKLNPFLSPSSESTDEDDVDESIEELTSLAVPSAAFVPPINKREKVPSLVVKEPIARPEVLPKPELPKKPQVAPRKPPVPSKPTLPPKPKIANKPKIASKTGSSEKETLVERKGSNDVQNINTIDIMQYIEQEQKASSTNANLFD